MSSRMRRPETARLEISRGDWLLVKKHLTAGEHRAMLNRYMVMGGNSYTVDPIKVEQSKMLAYLLDWSITDADDKPVVIRDQPEEVIGGALDALEFDSWQEIRNAIDVHEEAMDKLRAAEKNGRDGGSKSSVTSPSAEPFTGPLNTSAVSTEMSTASS